MMVFSSHEDISLQNRTRPIAATGPIRISFAHDLPYRADYSTKEFLHHWTSDSIYCFFAYPLGQKDKCLQFFVCEKHISILLRCMDFIQMGPIP